MYTTAQGCTVHVFHLKLTTYFQSMYPTKVLWESISMSYLSKELKKPFLGERHRSRSEDVAALPVRVVTGNQKSQQGTADFLRSLPQELSEGATYDRGKEVNYTLQWFSIYQNDKMMLHVSSIICTFCLTQLKVAWNTCTNQLLKLKITAYQNR